MTRMFFTAALAGSYLLGFPTTADAAPKPQPAVESRDAQVDIAAAVGRFVDAVNDGRFDQAATAFAPDATIVDDLPPYRWIGRDAASHWFLAMGDNAAQSHITSIFMEVGKPSRTDVSGDRAYVVVPGVLHVRTADRDLRARGTISYTLQRSGRRWLIDSLVWTGPEPA